MRGPSSRLAAFALALAIGAAGARSSGDLLPGAAASCSPGSAPSHTAAPLSSGALAVGPRTPGSLLPTGAETERASSGSDGGPETRPPHSEPQRCRPHPAGSEASPVRDGVRGFGGLLGLVASSPANAPPGS